MAPTFESALSTPHRDSIEVRGLDLPTEIMDELSFPAALYLLWTGDRPSEGEERLLDAVLTSMLAHWKSGPPIAARMTVSAEPDAIQAAIASGILGVGSRFDGTMQECATELGDLAEADHTQAAIDELVADYRRRDAAFPGLGHPNFPTVDPRARRLFEIAEEEGIAGEHVELLEAVRDAMAAETDGDIPINVTGAIAAVTADMGLAPAAARALAVVSRAGGVAGEALEEAQRPMVPDLVEYVNRNTVTPTDR